MRATLDLAGRRPGPFSRVPRQVWWSLAGVALVVLVWQFVGGYRAVQQERIADAREWRIEGPPCPQITAAQFVGKRQRGPRSFEYQGVTFFRRYGHVSCAPIYYDGGRSDLLYPVCQFTSPGDLLIRTRKGDWYFQPGPGQPATVSAAHDDARCVMASKFSLNPSRSAPQ